jgi:hypothetical protein
MKRREEEKKRSKEEKRRREEEKKRKRREEGEWRRTRKINIYLAWFLRLNKKIPVLGSKVPHLQLNLI